jgi:PKD repeat protein
VAAGVLTITNSGDYTLSWSLAEVAALEWLDETPLSGEVAAGASATVTLSYSAPVTAGVYNGQLQVSSNDPEQAEVEVPLWLVVEEGCEEVAGADFTWVPLSPFEGAEVVLTATVSGGSAPITYTWDLGDGTVLEGVVITHTYSAAGTYTVTLTASNCGGSATATMEHEVIVLVVEQEYVVYLPLVYRNQ